MNKLLSLFLFIFLISCSSSNDDTTPSLTIVNQNSSFPIVEVSLVGYKFENLNITSGISKTFQLSNGINEGKFTIVTVQIIISCGRQMPLYRNTTLDFSTNQTITIIDNKPDDTTPMNCGDAVIKS